MGDHVTAPAPPPPPPLITVFLSLYYFLLLQRNPTSPVDDDAIGPLVLPTQMCTGALCFGYHHNRHLPPPPPRFGRYDLLPTPWLVAVK